MPINVKQAYNIFVNPLNYELHLLYKWQFKFF